MARDDVNIRVSADTAEMVRLWQAAQEGPEKFGQAMQKAGTKGKAAGRDMGASVAGVIGQYASMGVMLHQTIGLINDAARAQREFEQATVDQTNRLDDLFNRFQVQSGLSSGKQADTYRTRILATAAQRKIGPEVATRTATELVSQGFSSDQVAGGALDEMLQLFVATNQGNVEDPESVVKAMTKWLRANQMKLTSENIRGESIKFQSLFQGTPIQLPDLERYARDAARLREFGGLSSSQSMALATQGLEISDMDQFSTQLKNAVTRLQTAGTNAQVGRGLGMIGLTPEDVQGRNFLGSMLRIQQAMGGRDVNTRDSAANLIFGQRGLDAYLRLTATPGALQETIARSRMAESDAAKQGYVEALAIGESGRGAAARQADVVEANALYRRGVLDPKVVRQRLQGVMGNLGLSDRERANVLSSYDDPFPGLPDSLNTPDARLRAGAQWAAYYGDPDYMSTFLLGVPTGDQSLRQEITGQLTGTQDIKIRLTGPDGRDIPHEVDAVNVGQPITPSGR